MLGQHEARRLADGAEAHHATSPLGDAPELCRWSAQDLGERFRKGEASPVEVAQAVLARAESVQPRLNAFVRIDHDGALRAARESEERWRKGEPLSAGDGVPVTIKDIVHVAGETISFGSKAVAPSRPQVDAPAVARLRQAGAVLIGLTTTPEFGWKALTDSPGFGVTRNPWDETRTPGGSSGGAAVAAATGCGVFHLGTDGGGSIRVPAAFTGTVGHKPTFGLVPAFPQSAFGTVAHLGPITRSVADTRLMLSLMSGRDGQDFTQPPFGALDVARLDLSLRGSRIGVWRDPPVGVVEPPVAAAFERLLGRLENAGAALEAFELPWGDRWLLDLFHSHWFPGAAKRLDEVEPGKRELCDPGFLQIAQAGQDFSAADYLTAAAKRAEFGAAMEARVGAHDFVVSPAVLLLPFAAGCEVPPGGPYRRWTEWASFSFPINLSQQPACVLPIDRVATADGRLVPVGLQIVGARAQDGKVLAAASAIEALLADGSA